MGEMDGAGTASSFFSDGWILTTLKSEWLKLKWLEDYQPSWMVVLTLLSAAVVLYFAWYYFLVVNRPRVVGGGTTLREHILNHCPILSQYYYPTLWAPNYHFTTIGREKLQMCPGVTFSRFAISV